MFQLLLFLPHAGIGTRFHLRLRLGLGKLLNHTFRLHVLAQRLVLNIISESCWAAYLQASWGFRPPRGASDAQYCDPNTVLELWYAERLAGVSI